MQLLQEDSIEKWNIHLKGYLKKGNENLIEPWAMNIAEVFLRETLGDIDVFAYTGLKKLMLLESISENIKK